MSSDGWTYSPSTNSPVNLTPGQVATWSQLGITTNTSMSVSFTINVQNVNSNWRSIFHATNFNADCCDIGDRVPAFWITANALTMHISNSTSTNGNDYFYTNSSLPLNTDTNILITWTGQTVNVYFNGSLNTTFTHSSPLTAANADANVYICDPWYSTGGFTIENFIISNGNTSSSASCTGLNYYGYSNGGSNNFNGFSTNSSMSAFGTTPTLSGTTTTINYLTNSAYGFTDIGGQFALEFSGFFTPTSTGSWGFILGNASENVGCDDVGILWVGQNAYAPTTSNSNGASYYYSSAITVYIQLTAGQSYPFLFRYGQNGGGYTMALAIIPPGGSYTYDGSQYFSCSAKTELTTNNFSTEYFSNKLEEEDKINNLIYKDSAKVVLILTIIIFITYIIYFYTNKKYIIIY